MASYFRNIQGVRVELTLIEIDPDAVIIDTTNPRVNFSMRQLDAELRNEAAATLLLTSQEDTESLKTSIILSEGVQEPIYIRSDRTVAEGNRRVVALRSAKADHPGDPRFATMPAWQFPEETSESLIQDLLNELHVGSVRGWAPYEKALQMKGLIDRGLTEEEVAQRYRMTAREVRQQLAAVEHMDRLYFPIADDPTDPENRTKFSYFLEFYKTGRVQAHCREIPDLPERFARWVKNERITAGAQVRRLSKVLSSPQALGLLEVVGLNAAEEFLAQQSPSEQELYSLVEKTRSRLASMNISELRELADSDERENILIALRDELEKVLEDATRFQ